MSICLAITDANWALTKDVFAVFGTVISFCGLLVAAYVGVGGLNTWRRQIRGQNDHDLALRMLAELYKFEMVLNASRAPGIYAHEVKLDAPQFAGGREGWFQRMELGFERRIEKISASFAALSAMSLNAKALWDFDIYDLLNNLQFLKDEYEEYVRLRLLCADPFESGDEKLDFKNEMDMRRNVFKVAPDLSDEFGAELESAVKRIEILLSKKIIK
jgi:hypothetical protein